MDSAMFLQSESSPPKRFKSKERWHGGEVGDAPAERKGVLQTGATPVLGRRGLWTKMSHVKRKRKEEDRQAVVIGGLWKKYPRARVGEVRELRRRTS